MIRRRKYLSLILIITVLMACGETAMSVSIEEPKTAKSAELPTLVLKLGDDLGRVKARSTLKINTDGILDHQTFYLDSPKKFVYDDPKLGFTLPDAGYFIMHTTLGHVVDISVGPHIPLLNAHKEIGVTQGNWHRNWGQILNYKEV